MKKIVSILLILLFILFLSDPATSAAGAGNGLLIWYQKVLPALLPMMFIGLMIADTTAGIILCRVLSPVISFIFQTSSYGSLALLFGLLCGYPMGGMMTAKLRHKELISPNEGRYLLSICSLPSPMFVFGYIASQIMGGIYPSYYYIVLYYGTIVLLSFISRYGTGYLSWNMSNIPTQNKIPSQSVRTVPDKSTQKAAAGYWDHPVHSKVSFYTALDQNITKSLNTILSIGLYMMCACTVAKHIEKWFHFNDLYLSVITGFVEMTSGIALCINIPSFSLRLAMCVLYSAFGGLCVLLQLSNFIKSARYSIKEYLAWKFVYLLLIGSILFIIEIIL